jgi:hypothetical protein
MSRFDIEEFVTKREGKAGPVHDWKWHCTSLPLGMQSDFCESVSIPFPSFNIKPLFGAGTFTFYPGFEEIQAFDCQFHLDEAMTTIKWLTAWKEKIRDPENGAFYLPTNYKFDIEFQLLGTKNDVLLTVVCKNCWPSTKSNWDLNYTSTNGLLKVHQNFSCDGIKLNI